MISATRMASDPTAVPSISEGAAVIMAWIQKTEAGCWEWQGHRDQFNYGKIGRGRSAHRVAYTVLRGPIPDGLVLDHLCRNRPCVNPDHLEPVTVAENNRRAAAVKTHCKRGHEFTPENTYAYRGRRCCRVCNRAAAARLAARKRAAS